MNNKLFFIALSCSLLFAPFTKPFYTAIFGGPSYTKSSHLGNTTQQQIEQAREALTGVRELQIWIKLHGLQKTLAPDRVRTSLKRLTSLKKQLQTILNRAVVYYSVETYYVLHGQKACPAEKSYSKFRTSPETMAEELTEQKLTRILAEINVLQDTLIKS